MSKETMKEAEVSIRRTVETTISLTMNDDQVEAALKQWVKSKYSDFANAKKIEVSFDCGDGYIRNVTISVVNSVEDILK